MPRLVFALPVVLAAALLSLAQQPKLDPRADPKKPFDIMDWTPRPAVGQAEPWEKMRDPQWDDARFRSMNTGPAQNATFRYQHGKDTVFVYKGTAVRLGEKGDACVIFDRATMRLAAGWTGGYLEHSVRRFGLLNTPTMPANGKAVFDTPSVSGWADVKGQFVDIPAATIPLPRDHVRYRGHYVHGDLVVFSYAVNGVEILESASLEKDIVPIICRRIQIAPHKSPLFLSVTDSQRGFTSGALGNGAVSTCPVGVDSRLDIVAMASKGVMRGQVVQFRDGRGWVLRKELLPADQPEVVELNYALRDAALGGEAGLKKVMESREVPKPLTALTKPGPLRWGKPLVTKLVKGDETGPFAVDTLTIPYDNPHKALFFCTGLDFLPDGRIAVCTCHGDVWLVKVDEATGECHWQRFATGLYHPLGLKVVDKKIVVLERGQLTRLHDHNDDGEADFYECVCNDWHTGNGEHSYDTCLETDPQGNFYFFKTGDTHLPHGGCLMKVSKDGGKVETFATGFRHPIGLGMSPTGIVTGADQEGNWMPATRVDQYKPGGFYGDMRAAHRQPLPTIYDGPLCWLPREVDNSAGGQTWVPATGDSSWTKSPLAGLPLHFSYGRCRPFVLLRQELKDGSVQGGVAPLPIQFLSGVCRGRFRPTDGNLYACGLNGWQTAAKADGCLQRVRLTGKPLDTVAKHAITDTGVTLTFTRPLDKNAAENPANYKAAWWNYRWSGDYGSKRWKVSNGLIEGQDDLVIASAKLLDEKTVAVTFAGGVKPVMQLQVGYNVKAADGAAVTGSVFLTVHKAVKE